jgi:8-oxo-dGTP pyrophosphatase MutT (NUDIX family)
MKEMSEPEAAVAIVHARCAEESVLLIRRTEREDDPWSGHWSFPGGRCDASDKDLIATALRELAEECGIHLGRDQLEASLAPAIAGRRLGRMMTVAPFLFRAETELPTRLDPEEAAMAAWVPLSLLRNPARHCLTAVPRLPPERIFPAIELNGMPLWGFTYRVIAEWLQLHAPEGVTEKPGFSGARLLLDFLLAQGMELRFPWKAETRGGIGTMVAGVKGRIPVAEVLSRFAFPSEQIPSVSSLEVRPGFIRVLGLELEEYLIQASE